MKILLTLAATALVAGTIMTSTSQAKSLTTAPTLAQSASTLASYRPGRIHPGRRILPRLCRMPRLNIRAEYTKLHFAGYKKIKYLGRKTHLSRCAQFLYFSACKGFYRYKVIVRYIRFTRYVIALKQGYCLTILPLPYRGYRAPDA